MWSPLQNSDANFESMLLALRIVDRFFLIAHRHTHIFMYNCIKVMHTHEIKKAKTYKNRMTWLKLSEPLVLYQPA